MKKTLERLASVGAIVVPVDLVLAVLTVPAALVGLVFRRLGGHRLKVTRSVYRRIGVFPVRDHYYEPLVNPTHLSRPLSEPRNLPAIDLNVDGQLALLDEMHRAEELVSADLASPSSDATRFRFGNTAFESGDAEYLYQFLRHTRPRQLVEIGSGSSTRLARMALERNREEFGVVAKHTCIEPYEQPWLEQLDGVEIVRERVENCGLNRFTELEDGDLLFIDSSHVIRPQGDVLYEYLEILPVLNTGVYIHIHDIFTPRDYLPDWVVERTRLWNEQYLVEALLSDSRRYKVVGALNYLKHEHYSALAQVCPYLSPDREPGSLYLRVC